MANKDWDKSWVNTNHQRCSNFFANTRNKPGFPYISIFASIPQATFMISSEVSREQYDNEECDEDKTMRIDYTRVVFPNLDHYLYP